MRPIDADQLRFVEACIEPTFVWDKPHWETIILKDRIDNAQTLDVMPVRHGKWIHGREVCREYIGMTLASVQYEHWKCSACGYRTEGEPLWKYCPNCGARMDGDQ